MKHNKIRQYLIIVEKDQKRNVDPGDIQSLGGTPNHGIDRQTRDGEERLATLLVGKNTVQQYFVGFLRIVDSANLYDRYIRV